MMRGGAPRSSMKLDNRPKKLLIKGVNEEGVQALRDWYEVGFCFPVSASIYLNTFQFAVDGTG